MITFSAKDLLTKSCRQIKMLNAHPEYKVAPSSMMIYGSKFQDAVADTIPNVIGQEMRGIYTNAAHGITINFSNDIVCNDRIIEVKSVVGQAPEWYRRSSLLQCALYKSLIMLGSRHLETASFYVNEGHERVEALVNQSIRYILIFGEEKYEVEVKDAAQIVGFFEHKAVCCSGTWALATNWDERYKHLEFECLKGCFSYRNIF